MAADFVVDVDAVASAARSVAQVVRVCGERPVDGVDCPVAAFGHEPLGQAVRDLCDRWQIGVAALAEDGSRIAEALAVTAQTYGDAESVAVRVLAEAGAGLEQAGAATVSGLAAS